LEAPPPKAGEAENENSTPQLSFDAHQNSAPLVVSICLHRSLFLYCLYSAARQHYNVVASSGFQCSWVHSHSIMPHPLRQCATQNIDMAVESED
jgi:hypothetical protein